MSIRTENISKVLRERNADAVILLNESNMHYFCGFSPSEGMVIITKENECYHIVDSRYTEIAQKHSQATGFIVIEASGSFEDEVSRLLEKHCVKSCLIENMTISLSQYRKFTNKMKSIEFSDLDNEVMKLRNIKDIEEIEFIKTANNIAEKSFIELLNEVKPGKTEKELAALFEYLMAKNGSDGISFDTILLTGAHTSMPHGVPDDRKVSAGDFVLFDFGATYKGYHSDMTRTVAVEYATDEMTECYNLVREAQLAGIKALNDGVPCAEVYQKAYDVLDKKDMAKYFRHGLGHCVGLEIHEGINASPRSRDTYQVGNVTSIEPGIYIPDKFGIRIEDLLYISPRGRENLSKVTKELIIL